MASPDPRGFASRPKKQASIAEAVARRDNIGTLAALTIDIVTLSPLFHFHGGAPRGERPASWDAERARGEINMRTRLARAAAPAPAGLRGTRGRTRPHRVRCAMPS